MKFVKKDNNLIINADCTDPEVKQIIKQEVGLDVVSLIITDPPYGQIVKESWDQASSNDYILWTKLCSQYLADGGSAFIWGGVGKKQDRVFFDFLSKVETLTDLTIRNVITWSKKRAYGKINDYLFTREELVWLVKGDLPKTFNIPLLEEKRGYPGYNKKYPAKSEYKRRTNVWTDVTEILQGKQHPTEKPAKLTEILCQTHSNPGDYVIDFFAGSGSTGIGARNTGRKFILVEREEKYYQQMIKRLFEG